MSKRNIAYIKPDEPAFLKRLKQSIGYTEGTTVETKFETLPDGPENLSDNESEKPQVVVLAPGDLTKEEADNLKKNIDLENENKPADLSQRIVFKSKKKTENEENPKKNTDNESRSKKKTVNPPKLSFDVDDEDSDER